MAMAKNSVSLCVALRKNPEVMHVTTVTFKFPDSHFLIPRTSVTAKSDSSSQRVVLELPGTQSQAMESDHDERLELQLAAAYQWRQLISGIVSFRLPQ